MPPHCTLSGRSLFRMHWSCSPVCRRDRSCTAPPASRSTRGCCCSRSGRARLRLPARSSQSRSTSTGSLQGTSGQDPPGCCSRRTGTASCTARSRRRSTDVPLLPGRLRDSTPYIPRPRCSFSSAARFRRTRTGMSFLLPSPAPAPGRSASSCCSFCRCNSSTGSR